MLFRIYPLVCLPEKTDGDLQVHIVPSTSSSQFPKHSFFQKNTYNGMTTVGILYLQLFQAATAFLVTGVMNLNIAYRL